LQNICLNACFNSLTTARGLENLQRIGKNAHFNSLIDLKSIEHIKIGGKINLPNNIKQNSKR